MEFGNQPPAAPAPAAELASSIAASPAQPAVPAAGAGDVAQQATQPGDASQTTPPPVDPRAEINTLSQQFGINLDGFTDVASAKAALRMLTEQSAAAGMDELQSYAQPQYNPAYPMQNGTFTYTPPAQGQQYAVQPQVPTPAPTAQVKTIDLKALGLEEDDPAAKAIRSLESMLGQASQSVQAIEQRVTAYEQQQQDAARAQRNAEANAYLDSLQSPQFGVGRNQTWAQQQARQALFQESNAILAGDARLGRPISPIPQRLARTLLLRELQAGGPAPAAAFGNNAPAPPAPALKTTSPAPTPAQPVGLHQQWSQNPQMRASAGIDG